ncbi:MAG: Fis family transcriptional regulator [Legionellales bacterium]|nr:Fis family transcriptional regulator [Legionellales bacterium]
MTNDFTQLTALVKKSARFYIEALDGHNSSANLHTTVIGMCEKALISEVISATDGNMTQAARILGLSRGTLRKKLQETTA